jgi:hypothetical protein
MKRAAELLKSCTSRSASNEPYKKLKTEGVVSLCPHTPLKVFEDVPEMKKKLKKKLVKKGLGCDREKSGREKDGRFAVGNQISRCPHSASTHVRLLRQALLAAVSENDIQCIARALVTAAVSGNVSSAKLVFDRVAGRQQSGTDPSECADKNDDPSQWIDERFT